MGVPSESGSLIDARVSVEQCGKAISALLGHVRKKQREEDEAQLLPGKEQFVWLVMTVKRMQPMKNLKPHKIPIEHPLVDPRTTSVCLITKDPQREYKELLASHNIKFISRVVGLEKLKGKFKGFDARRLLLHENGLFLADERVIPLLPGLLGKQWFKSKKQPIPVSLTKRDLKAELEKAISSTYMHQNQGTCTSIKIARMSHKDSQVLSNLKAAIPAVVARIHGGWDNVQSFNIKTSSSVSLPIWTCPLGSDEPGSRWAGMTVDEGEWSGFGADENDGAEEPEVDEPTGPIEPTSSANPTKLEKSKARDTPPQNSGTKRAADAAADADADVEPGAKKRRRVKKTKPTDEALALPADDTVTAAETTAKPLEESVTEQKKPRKPRKRKSSTNEVIPSPVDATPAKPPSGQAAMPTKIPEQTLTRKEMKIKKDALGDARMEKKKGRLRDTEKSGRKGVKAQLVGKVKA